MLEEHAERAERVEIAHQRRFIFAISSETFRASTTSILSRSAGLTARSFRIIVRSTPVPGFTSITALFSSIATLYSLLVHAHEDHARSRDTVVSSRRCGVTAHPRIHQVAQRRILGRLGAPRS